MNLYVKEEETGEYRPAGANEILSAFNEAKLAIRNGLRVDSAANVAPQLMAFMQDMTIENVVVLYLNNDNKVVHKTVHTSGVEDQCHMHPKNIIRTALLNYATGVLLAHNHPTGRTAPSQADLNITKRINEACETMEVRLVDHLIIGRRDNEDYGAYYSFREHDKL